MQDDDLLLGAPRTLGEIITEAVSTLRRHLKTALVLMLPFCAVELFFREAASTLLARLRKSADALQATEGALSAVVFEILLPLGGALLLLLLSLMVLVAVLTCAIVHAAAALRGHKLSPGEVLKRGMRFWARALVAELILDMTLLALTVLPWSLGVVAALLVGGALQWVILVLTGAVWLALMIAVYLRWVLYPEVIVLEDRGPIECLIRSSEMMSPAGVRFLAGPKLRLSAILLVYWVIASVVQSTFLLPLGIVGYLDGIPLAEMPPPLALVPLWVALPVAVVQVLTNSVLYPLKAYLGTVFYFDLQVRYGELDGGSPAPDSSPS